jgi:hypothetical protein
MVFESFAFLHSGPVHEETVLGIAEKDCTSHHEHDGRSHESTEDSEHQAYSTKSLRGDDHDTEGVWDAGTIETFKSRCEPVAAEQAKSFLQSMRQDD